MIQDFTSTDEGDGCGGGTTLYETSFTYADNTKYEYRYCEGEESDGRSRIEKPVRNKAKELNTIFYEFGLDQTAGWRTSITLEKVECTVYKGNNTRCTLTSYKQ